MTLLEFCQYTAVSRVCTLEATYCPFESHVYIQHNSYFLLTFLLLLPGFYSPIQAKTALTMPLHWILSRPAGIDSGFLTMYFLWGGVVSPTPNPQHGGPGLCIYNPQALGTHFGRLLRPVWATVRPFFFPTTTREPSDIYNLFFSSRSVCTTV
jgi:hypothetical protein